MTDSFLMRWCTEKYDQKPFWTNKIADLRCCIEQQRERDYFEVRRIAAPKRHTKYIRTRQLMNHVDHTRYTWSPTPRGFQKNCVGTKSRRTHVLFWPKLNYQNDISFKLLPHAWNICPTICDYELYHLNESVILFTTM